MLNLGILEKDIKEKPFSEFIKNGTKESIAHLRHEAYNRKVRMTQIELNREK